MEQFRKILEGRHNYAREWKKRTGGKVLGYYEPYFPEEIAYAYGILPVRIMAEHEPDDRSDRQMYGNCYCTRDMLNQFLRGRYDYIDGIAATEGCQWMFNAFQTTMNSHPDLFAHFLFVPDYPEARSSKDLMISEIRYFQKKLEDWTGKVVTDEELDRAIDTYNKTRRLLRRLYELRKADNSVISGSEAMDIALTSQIMDKAEINPMLEEALPRIEEREPRKDGIRLILIGSETYDTELEKLIESLGANVVIDELDNGSSYFWNEVVPQKDRIKAIALRYLEREHSALKDSNWRRRPEHIYQLCEDFKVDAAIIAKQIYCHPHGSDNYAIWKLLRERSIPFHFFERDMTLPNRETRLRLESFLTMVKPGVTRLAGWNRVAQL